MNKYKIGAFIITYDRPTELLRSLGVIQNQTLAPEYILIIDNSSSNNTSNLNLSSKFPNLDYVHMNYNSGPAGAANYGLRKLTEMGCDWIFWGDDNNPPRDLFVFEEMMSGIEELLRNGVNLGIFGGKGGNFNSVTGRISSLRNKELFNTKYVEVDSVPGGHNMFVNSQVVEDGILPTEKLFFGFEEFDFCLKVKGGSYDIYIDAKKWLEVRRNHNDIEDSYKWKDKSFGKQELLNREYYSTRNLLYIFYCYNYYIPFLYLLLKSISKMLAGFRFGLSYGRRMFFVQYHAITSFFQQKYYENLKYRIKV